MNEHQELIVIALDVAKSAVSYSDALTEAGKIIELDRIDAAIEWVKAQGWPNRRWAPVDTHKNRYEVSDFGEVKDIQTGRLLGQWINQQGYSLVRLSNPRASVRVHRMVASAFVPNPSNFPCVNHIDFNRSNNNVDNLEWCTQQMNLEHSRKYGRMQENYWKGKRSPNAILSVEQVFAIRQEYSNGNISWSGLAKKFNISKRTIGRVIKFDSYI